MKRSASRAFPRSTAMVYWVRSLVPTLKNALTFASLIGDQHGRGRLDHDADRHGLRRAHARGLERWRPPPARSPVASITSSTRVTKRKHELDVPTHGRAEHGADLRPEHLRLVQADADRPPAQERVGLWRGLEGNGELVPAQIERADDDGLLREGQGDAAEVLRLLVLGGQGGTTGEEELGAQQAHALRAEPLGGLDLLGQVHVAHAAGSAAPRA